MGDFKIRLTEKKKIAHFSRNRRKHALLSIKQDQFIICYQSSTKDPNLLTSQGLLDTHKTTKETELLEEKKKNEKSGVNYKITK